VKRIGLEAGPLSQWLQGYGLSAPFRQGLTALGLALAVGIPRHLKVYPVDVKLIWPAARHRRPRKRHSADRDADFAVLGGCETHLHKSLRPSHSLADLPAKATVREFRPVASDHLAVEPGRTIAANLLVKVEGRERSDSKPITTTAQFVGLSAWTMSSGIFQWSASIRSA
jgi:DDE superfamily endonuclease